MLEHRVRVRFALRATRGGVAGAANVGDGAEDGAAGGLEESAEVQGGDSGAEEPVQKLLPSFSFHFRPFDLEALPEQRGEVPDLEGPLLDWSHDVEMEVNEAVVRDIVAAGARTTFVIGRTWGEEKAEGAAVHSGCGALLVGDRVVSRKIPTATLPDSLCDWDDVHLEVRVTDLETPDEGKEAEGVEAASASEDAPSSAPLLPPDLARALNPIVIEIARCESLPDQPATISQLDDLCEPVWLTYTFPGADKGRRHEGKVGPWDDRGGAEGVLSTRNVDFGVTDIYLGADLPGKALYEALSEQKLEVQVHDRTAYPEEHLMATSKVDAGAEVDGGGGGEVGTGAADCILDPDDDWAVYGKALFDLGNFCKGYTRLRLESNLIPATTLRGGADLEWKTRPGRYLESEAVLSAQVRMATPLKPPEALRPYVRAVFIMDYTDNEMLHTVQDGVRSTNAEVLELQGTDAHILQTLTTYKLSEEQMADSSLDLLTGFHLIDSDRRLIVVEGLKVGSMSIIDQIAAELIGTSSERRILINFDIEYEHRLYSSFGVDLKPIKLRSTLSVILADAGMVGSGKVRFECKEGLRCLAKLTEILWFRQADRMHLMPTHTMLNYVDKKFGGELTKDDIFGVSDDVAYTGTHPHEPGRLITDLEKSGEEGIEQAGATRLPKGSLKPDVECANPKYLRERERLRRLRKQRDFVEEYMTLLRDLQVDKSAIKQEWLTWNPQSEVLGNLARGDVTNLTCRGVEFEILAERRQKSKAAAEEAERAPFIWPAPREPKDYIVHSKRLTDARIEELSMPWIENEMNVDHQIPKEKGTDTKLIPFKTIMPAPSILEKDPEYFTSVHLCGEGLIRELAEDKQREIDEWNGKVVVKDVHFKAILKNRKKVSQTDRHEITLKDSPAKLGLVKAHCKPITKSIFLEEPYKEADKTILLRKANKTKFTAGSGKDFCRFIQTEGSALSTRPTLQQD